MYKRQAETLEDPVAVEQTVVKYTDAGVFFVKKGPVYKNFGCQKILTSMDWTQIGPAPSRATAARFKPTRFVLRQDAPYGRPAGQFFRRA